MSGKFGGSPQAWGKSVRNIAGNVKVSDVANYLTAGDVEAALAEIMNPALNLQVQTRTGVNALLYVTPSDWNNILTGVETATNYAGQINTALASAAVKSLYIPGLIYCGATGISIPANKEVCGASGALLGGVATSESNFRFRDFPAGAGVTLAQGSKITGVSIQSVGTPNASARGIQVTDAYVLNDVRVRNFPTGIYYTGNQFYGRQYSVSIYGATNGHWWTVNSYNQQFHSCIIRATAKPFRQDTNIPVNIEFFGGSVEGMTVPWDVQQFSHFAFTGTYFELSAADWAAAGSSTTFDFITLATSCQAVFKNCTIFHNYIRRFVSASGITNVSITFNDNYIRGDTTADTAVSSCLILPPASGNVYARGNSWRGVAGPNAKFLFTDALMVAWDVVEPVGYPVAAGRAVLVVDPASLAAGATQQFTVTLTGAAVGMRARATHSQVNVGIVWLAEVTAANTVTVTQWNRSAAAIDLASGNLTVYVSPDVVR